VRSKLGFVALLVASVWSPAAAQAACDERCDADCATCCKVWTVVASCESVVARDSSYASRAAAARVANWLNQRASNCSSSTGACEAVRLECGPGRPVAEWRAVCEPVDRAQEAALFGQHAAQLEAGRRWARAAVRALEDAQQRLAVYQTRPDATARGRTKADALAKELTRLKAGFSDNQARLSEAAPSSDPGRLITDQAALLRKAGDAIAQGRKLAETPEGIDAKYADKQAQRALEQQRKEERARAEQQSKQQAAAAKDQAAADKELAAAARDQAAQGKALAEAETERAAALSLVAQASNQADAGILSAAKLLAGSDLSAADRTAITGARAELERAKANLGKSFGALKATTSESNGKHQLEQVKKLKADVAATSREVEGARSRLMQVIQRRAGKR